MTNWIGIATKQDIDEIKNSIKIIDAQISVIQRKQEYDGTQINYLLGKEIKKQKQEKDMTLKSFKFPVRDIEYNSQECIIDTQRAEIIKLEKENKELKSALENYKSFVKLDQFGVPVEMDWITRFENNKLKNEVLEWKAKYECEYQCNWQLAEENHKLKNEKCSWCGNPRNDC